MSRFKYTTEEERKKAAVSSKKKWRQAHPEKYDTLVKRANNRSAQRRILKKAESRFDNYKPNWMEKQIAHSLSRGRDVGSIAVGMGIPVSRIVAVIEKSKLCQNQKNSVEV